jgi:hypothetical protein
MMTYKVRTNEAVDIGDGTTRVFGKCMFTGTEHSVVVKTVELRSWLAGISIQNAMPKTSADDREFLLSGITPSGWDKYVK